MLLSWSRSLREVKRERVCVCVPVLVPEASFGARNDQCRRLGGVAGRNPSIFLPSSSEWALGIGGC